MNLDKVVVAILRIFNSVVSHLNDSYGRSNLQAELDAEENVRKFYKSLGFLTPEERKMFASIVKTMALMTGGNVDTIRNNSLYDAAAAGTWDTVMSEEAAKVLQVVQPGLDPTKDTPTLEDYQTAQKLLPIMGSHLFSDQDTMNSGAAVSKFLRGKPMETIPTTLYRGLKSVDMSLIIELTQPGVIWDMKRGVSTSRYRDLSYDFASLDPNGRPLGGGPSIFFVISNPKQQGFLADRLSKFGGEGEIILSSVLKVDNWRIEADIEFYQPSGPRMSYLGNGLLVIDSRRKEMSVQANFRGGKEVVKFEPDLNKQLSKLLTKKYVKFGQDSFVTVVPEYTVIYINSTIQ